MEGNLLTFDQRIIKMRQFAATKMDMVEKLVAKSEADIPAKYWLDLSPADKDKYTAFIYYVLPNVLLIYLNLYYTK